MSLSKFLTFFFFFPYFRLWTWALFMDQNTLLFLQKQGKNSCPQFRRLWTWSFLILQREDMLLRLVLPSLNFSPSQTYHYSFSFLGFQITILNSPTQFLSLTHSLFFLQSLSWLCRVCACVYGCLAVGLGFAILVGMWPSPIN